MNGEFSLTGLTAGLSADGASISADVTVNDATYDLIFEVQSTTTNTDTIAASFCTESGNENMSYWIAESETLTYSLFSLPQESQCNQTC